MLRNDEFFSKCPLVELMSDSVKTFVIALGGNAILSEDDPGDVVQLMSNMELACRQLAPLTRSGNRVVITQGNGPQVDNLLIQQGNSAPEIRQQPLDKWESQPTTSWRWSTSRA